MPDTALKHKGIPEYFGMFAKIKALGIEEQTPGAGDFYGSGLADFYDYSVKGYQLDIPVYKRYLPTTSCRVLDLAAGSGRVGVALASMGFAVDGLELSADMLELADNKVVKLPPNQQALLRFFQGDMTDFFLGEQYDLIVLGATSISLLTSTEERANMLTCIKKHLKPNAKFIFDIIAEDQLQEEFEVFSQETDDGVDFAVLGHQFWPDDGIFVTNMMREFCEWNGSVKRYFGSSKKALLTSDLICKELAENEYKIIETVRVPNTLFFVTQPVEVENEPA